MSQGIKIEYMRRSTNGRDLQSQRERLENLGVDADRINVDPSRIGKNRDRPGRGQAVAAGRKVARTLDGVSVAKAYGRLRDFRPQLTVTRKTQVILPYDQATHTPTEVGEMFGVTRQTAYGVVQNAREGAAA